MSFYLQFLIFSRACFRHENSFKSEKQDHFHSISSKSCKSKSGLIFPILGHFHAAKGLWTLDKVVTFWQRKFVVQLSWQIFVLKMSPLCQKMKFVLKMSWQMRTLHYKQIWESLPVTWVFGRNIWWVFWKKSWFPWVFWNVKKAWQK